MAMSERSGFRCRADRERDAELDAKYRSIGIKSVEAAQKLCREQQVARPAKGVNAEAEHSLAVLAKR